VDEQVVDGVTVVRAVGEVNVRTASLLAARLAQATATTTPPVPVVVDLREVEFFGSTGISMLITAHRTCLDRFLSLRVVAGPSVTHRLGMVGLAEVLTIGPTLPEALHDQQTPPQDMITTS
jgi:anti-sigma B factor antagonist